MARHGPKSRQPERKRRHDAIPVLRTRASRTSCSDTMSELEIWSSADILLNRFGGAVVLIASRRSDMLLDRGELKAASEWGRIVMAIANLERKRFGNGNMSH